MIGSAAWCAGRRQAGGGGVQRLQPHQRTGWRIARPPTDPAAPTPPLHAPHLDVLPGGRHGQALDVDAEAGVAGAEVGGRAAKAAAAAAATVAAAPPAGALQRRHSRQNPVELPQHRQGAAARSGSHAALGNGRCGRGLPHKQGPWCLEGVQLCRPGLAAHLCDLHAQAGTVKVVTVAAAHSILGVTGIAAGGRAKGAGARRDSWAAACCVWQRCMLPRLHRALQEPWGVAPGVLAPRAHPYSMKAKAGGRLGVFMSMDSTLPYCRRAGVEVHEGTRAGQV